MIVWFDKSMTMHVDKQHDANNSFVLAKYIPNGYSASDVVFKANAVVNGKTLLLTHTQVTGTGARLVNKERYVNTSATIRKYFFKFNLSKIENSIEDYLRRTKGYTGEIKLRFRVGEGTVDLFQNYSLVNKENCFTKDGYYYACFCILEKKLQ